MKTIARIIKDLLNRNITEMQAIHFIQLNIEKIILAREEKLEHENKN